jgi:hypothetical protein
MIRSRIFNLPVVAAAIFTLFLLHEPVEIRAQSKEPASSAHPQQHRTENTARIPGKSPAALNPNPLNVHGPFVLSVSAMAKVKREIAPQVTVFSEQHRFGIGIGPALGRRPPEIPLGTHGPGRTPATPQPSPLNANPAVVSGWYPIDPQIAVGSNDVVVTLRDHILLFNKADIIGQPAGANVTPATVFTTDGFFDLPLTNNINQHLNQPPGYDASNGYGIDPGAYPGTPEQYAYYDARALYDSYRKRFWVIALAVTQKAGPYVPSQEPFPNTDTCKDPIRQSARRTKIAVAVSQGDNAFGAWNFYWWDGNKDEDTDPRIISTHYFSHVDYPLLGLSEHFLLVENRAAVCQTGLGACGTPNPCVPPNPQKNTENYGYVTVAYADDLATGSLPSGKTTAFGFKSFKYPNGTVIPPGYSIAPAVHDGSVPNGRSFFANPYVDSTGKSWLMIWYLDWVVVRGSLTPVFSNLTVPIRPLSQIPLGSPLPTPTAAFRGQELTVAFGEQVSCKSPSKVLTDIQARTYALNTSITAIRVIRVNVLNHKVIFDSTIGRRDPDDPPNVDCVNYFQPAIQVNKNGDTALVYMREAKVTVPTEVRYAVIYQLVPNSAQLQGGTTYSQPLSAVLQGGTTDQGLGFDTSGISLDPDDQAIWFVAAYGSPTGPQIAIGRIWGK